jgi:hypothetical protein
MRSVPTQGCAVCVSMRMRTQGVCPRVRVYACVPMVCAYVAQCDSVSKRFTGVGAGKAFPGWLALLGAPQASVRRAGNACVAQTLQAARAWLWARSRSSQGTVPRGQHGQARPSRTNWPQPAGQLTDTPSGVSVSQRQGPDQA